MMLAPNRQQHMRNISVVAADTEGPKGPQWSIVRARLRSSPTFADKITVPQLSDESVVDIEVDRTDPHWGPHKYWGALASPVRLETFATI